MSLTPTTERRSVLPMPPAAAGASKLPSMTPAVPEPRNPWLPVFRLSTQRPFRISFSTHYSQAQIFGSQGDHARAAKIFLQAALAPCKPHQAHAARFAAASQYRLAGEKSALSNGGRRNAYEHFQQAQSLFEQLDHSHEASACAARCTELSRVVH